MAKLTTEARNALPDDAFALKGRRFPIHDMNHARNALARVHQYGSERDRLLVKVAVHRKFPSLKAFSFNPSLNPEG